MTKLNAKSLKEEFKFRSNNNIAIVPTNTRRDNKSTIVVIKADHGNNRI